MDLKVWAMASRMPFFVAVIIPSIVGGAVAFYHGSFDLFLFLIVVVGMVLANAGTNFMNDYFDFKSGADVDNPNRTPFSGGSPFLADQTLRPKSVLYAGSFCFAIGLLIAIYLTIEVGYIVLILAGIGAFIGFFYTAPPIKLGYWGAGEFATGFALGPLTIIGVYYVITGTITVEPIVVSIPIGVLVATILYVNEIPDHDADKRAGKRHLVVILGKAKAVKFLPMFFLLIYSSIILGVVLGIMPAWTLIALLTIPVALNVITIANSNYDNTTRYIPAMARTIAIHSITGMLLTAGYLIPAFIG